MAKEEKVIEMKDEEIRASVLKIRRKGREGKGRDD